MTDLQPESLASGSSRGSGPDVLAALRTVEPHLATPEHIRQLEAAIDAIDASTDPELWLEARARLASFLFENRIGDRRESVAKATNIYSEMLLSNLEETHPRAWASAVCGFANCLSTNPNAAQEVFDGAEGLLEKLVARERAGSADPETLAVALSCHARLRLASPFGDRDANLGRAIVLTREEIAAIGSGEQSPSRWSRAHQNLAGLYSQLRVGLRSQHVDDAIRVLHEALKWRSRESDPGGRARTLRGLAQLLPEWSGADSLAHAYAMAEACWAEAEEIAATDPRATVSGSSWGPLAGQRSALNADLDPYLTMLPEDGVRAVKAAIALHQKAVEQLSPESMPSQWADWKGGLGQLFARLAHFDMEGLDREDAADTAYRHLLEALAVVSAESHPRLCRDLHRAMGQLGHQLGVWQLSHRGYESALEISRRLFDDAAAPDSRRQELVEMRGFALLAAYGAARTGQLDDAIRLAELGRARSLIEMLSTMELLTSSAPLPIREALSSTSDRVRSLEAELRQLAEQDPRAQAQRVMNRLVDYLGGDPGVLKMRVTNPEAIAKDLSAEYPRIGETLRSARADLREALSAARKNQNTLDPLDAERIRDVAAALGCPLIYLMATVYGGMALIVLPTRSIKLIQLDDATSTLTRTLLYGTNERAGFVAGAVAGDQEALAQSLPGVLAALEAAVGNPLAAHLIEHGHRRAIVVALGTIGLLPLHAAMPADVAIGYAPSARALRLSAEVVARPGPAAHLLAVGNPARADDALLPMAIAEVRAVAAMPDRWTSTSVLVGAGAAKDAIEHVATGATHLHFACHGVFRAHEPLESALLLAGDDVIRLGDLFDGSVRFPDARLAILCACHTANVDPNALPDEMLGLPMGMLVAGVPGVIGTAWPVPDRAGALFAQRFHEELVHLDDPLVAVTSAQRWLRDASGEELAGAVSRMRAALLPEDDDTDAELSRYWRWLMSLTHGEHPCSAPECWAAFAYLGP